MLNYLKTLDSRFHGNDDSEGLSLVNQALWAYTNVGPFGVGSLLVNDYLSMIMVCFDDFKVCV